VNESLKADRITGVRLYRLAKRLFVFGLVGACCFLVQFVLMTWLQTVLHHVVAYAIAFMASAQLNFVLSYYFTWRDSKRKKGLRLLSTWGLFFAVALLGLVVNYFVYDYAHVMLLSILALLAATVASTCFTFVFNHLFVLSPERKTKT
jgi:putative flippase GtrA